MAGGDLEASNGLFGIEVESHTRRRAWIRITGRAAGTNRYSWEEVDVGGAPNFDGTLAEGFGGSGGPGEADFPAYEVNGNEDVPVGEVVEADVLETYLVFTSAERAPAPSSSETPAEPTGSAWVAALRQGHCLRVSVVSQGGACACPEPSSTSSATPSTDNGDPVYLASCDGAVWDVSPGECDQVGVGCDPDQVFVGNATFSVEWLDGTCDCAEAYCPTVLSQNTPGSPIWSATTGPSNIQLWRISFFGGVWSMGGDHNGTSIGAFTFISATCVGGQATVVFEGLFTNPNCSSLGRFTFVVGSP